MKRLPDWPARLHAFVDGTKRQEFAWDRHNCAQWAIGAVKSITGEDIATEYRGKFKSAKGAVGTMKRSGFTNLADMAAFILPEIHISQARIGDIAAIPDNSPFGYTLGIINGETILVLGEKSMGIEPLFHASRAFQVG